MVAKANSGARSTEVWNAIDTDAVDADRSQAGRLPQLLAVRRAGSQKGPAGCKQGPTSGTLPVIRMVLKLSGATSP